MKFAVISDIHGNLPALNAVIEDAGSNNIDTFIFAGDYCLSNPFPDECITRIKKLPKKYVIRGNEEIYASYDRCYCGHLKEYGQQVPSEFCNCSRGWFLELFEKTLHMPVQVELVDSIVQGGKECQFIISFESDKNL